MGKSDPPAPPNPYAVAGAQTNSNVSTAVANAFLGNVNQNTPTGSLTYSPTGSYAWGDPSTGQTYNIPTFTATQTLSPSQQNLLNINDQTQLAMANIGLQQANALSGFLGGGVNVAGAPAGGSATTLANAPQAQTTFGNAGPISTGFGQAGDISQQIAGGGPISQQLGPFGSIQNQFGQAGNVQGQLGSAGNVQNQLNPFGNIQGQINPFGNVQNQFADVGGTVYGFGGTGDITRTYGDFANERNRIEQGLMERLNPSLEQERARYEQQLADQGIRYGSPAYENAMRNYSMQANDARLAAIGQAGSEQQRMADMAAQRAGFQNAAQQQEFQQAQARGAFYNTAQNQAYQQALGRGQFANQAQQQAYLQSLGQGQFANEAQQQAYLQSLGQGQFANQAQQQLYNQLLSSGQFANQAQQQLYQQELGRGQFANTAQQQAYQQALGAGTFQNQAQQQQFAQNAAQSEFYNKAQQQLYEQLYGRETFANQAQNQLFQQQAAQGTFANAGLAQNYQQQQAAFNAAQAARSQYWNEQFALRNQPLNELSALISGSQVQQPNFVGANMPTIPTTDMAGILNTNFNQQMDIYKQNSTNMNNLIGGVLGFGGQALRSDRDVKENIDRIGTVFGVGDDSDEKLPIYRYSYKDDPTKQRRVGPMAQDVEKIDKRAVRKIGGVKHIDTGRLGEILKVA